MREPTDPDRPPLACTCLIEEGRAPRRSVSCPEHGCTCGTGRRSGLTHRGARDSSCPRHGDHSTNPAGAAAAAPVIPPVDAIVLVEVDLAILQLEKQVFKYQGEKEKRCARIMGGAFHGVGGRAVTRYYQRLNQLIDHPEANRLEPALMARLREQRKDP